MSIILSSCFSKSLHTLDIFYPIFLQRLLNLLRLSLLLVPCILLLGLSLILLCLCMTHILLSFLSDGLCIFVFLLLDILLLWLVWILGGCLFRRLIHLLVLFLLADLILRASICLIHFLLPIVCPLGTFLVFL